MLLNNGCLCCVLRGDLQETLRDLFVKRRMGEIIDFERVIIETTGLADPAPVMQTLMSDTMLQSQYRLDCVVTLVDAVNGLEQIETMSGAGQAGGARRPHRHYQERPHRCGHACRRLNAACASSILRCR